MSENTRQLMIGDVAVRAGMSASRIRFYESRGVLPEPERVAGRRRYSPEVLRRFALRDAGIIEHYGRGEWRSVCTLGNRADRARIARERGAQRRRDCAVRRRPRDSREPLDLSEVRENEPCG